jgi:hypothetical protein
MKGYEGMVSGTPIEKDAEISHSPKMGKLLNNLSRGLADNTESLIQLQILVDNLIGPEEVLDSSSMVKNEATNCYNKLELLESWLIDNNKQIERLVKRLQEYI